MSDRHPIHGNADCVKYIPHIGLKMYLIAASDQRTTGVMPAFGLKVSNFVFLLNLCKCGLAGPLRIELRSEKQELVEKVTL